MSESKPSPKELPPARGSVDSVKVYNTAAEITPRDILKALSEFDEAVPKQYKGLMLIKRGFRNVN